MQQDQETTNHHDKDRELIPMSLKWAIGVVIVMLLSVVVLRVINVFDQTERSAIDPIDGLVLVDTPEEAKELTGDKFVLPEETYGSSLYQVGVYTLPVAFIPPGSVSLVYAENQYRSFTIDFLPGTDLASQKNIYSTDRFVPVSITSEIDGAFVQSSFTSRCLEPNRTSLGKCSLIATLLMKVDDTVIKINSDGEHLTQGEMISVARSVASLFAEKESN